MRVSTKHHTILDLQWKTREQRQQRRNFLQLVHQQFNYEAKAVLKTDHIWLYDILYTVSWENHSKSSETKTRQPNMLALLRQRRRGTPTMWKQQIKAAKGLYFKRLINEGEGGSHVNSIVIIIGKMTLLKNFSKWKLLQLQAIFENTTIWDSREQQLCSNIFLREKHPYLVRSVSKPCLCFLD